MAPLVRTSRSDDERLPDDSLPDGSGNTVDSKDPAAAKTRSNAAANKPKDEVRVLEWDALMPADYQAVIVESPQGVGMRRAFDRVWVTGRMAVKTTNTALVDAGYTLRATHVEPYTE